MKYSIHISNQAYSDISSIYEYIAFDLQSAANAAGQISRIEEFILSLSQMPERHPIYEKEPWKTRGLRSAYVDNYNIFYIVDNDKEVVYIVRVMYSGRDMGKQLNERLR